MQPNSSPEAPPVDPRGPLPLRTTGSPLPGVPSVPSSQAEQDPSLGSTGIGVSGATGSEGYAGFDDDGGRARRGDDNDAEKDEPKSDR